MYKYKISVISGNILRKSSNHVSISRYLGVDGANLRNISPQIQHGYFYVFYQHMFAYTEQPGVLGVWMKALLFTSGDL